MQFDTLIGNAPLKERLHAALSKGQLSHCYLISGPKGSGKRTLARLLAAAMQCSQPEKPCMRCPQCLKVLHGTHPDIITVDEPEKKTIAVKTVRDACSDLYIRPNEGNRKIYFFPRAQAVNPQGQNALLKCVEEPPPYGAFVLLAEHGEQLLPTIRSRCVELRMAPLTPQELLPVLKQRFPGESEDRLTSAVRRSGGYLGQALELLEQSEALLPQSVSFINAYCGRQELELLQLLTSMEKLKREALKEILMQWHALLSSALLVRSGACPDWPECRRIAAVRPASELLQSIDAIQKVMTMTDANVGAGHLCGALTVLLR